MASGYIQHRIVGRPIWEIKTKTAVDIRSRIELILNWAKIHGYRDGENPARWKGHLDNALPKPAKVARVTHLAAMPYDDLPALMVALRAKDGNAAAALEWTILSAARTDETFGASWDEIDIERKVWTVPSRPYEGGLGSSRAADRSNDRSPRKT